MYQLRGLDIIQFLAKMQLASSHSGQNRPVETEFNSCTPPTNHFLELLCRNWATASVIVFSDAWKPHIQWPRAKAFAAAGSQVDACGEDEGMNRHMHQARNKVQHLGGHVRKRKTDMKVARRCTVYASRQMIKIVNSTLR